MEHYKGERERDRDRERGRYVHCYNHVKFTAIKSSLRSYLSAATNSYSY